MNDHADCGLKLNSRVLAVNHGRGQNSSYMSTLELNARQCVIKAPYINFCAIFTEEMVNSALAPEKTSGPENFENLKNKE